MAEKTKIKESCVMYRSWYEALQNMPPEQRLKMYDCMFQYSFYDIEPELSDVTEKIFWQMFDPVALAAQRRHEAAVKNGKKGGGQKGNKNAYKGAKNDNQNLPKTSQNDLNVNANVNVNKNTLFSKEESIIITNNPYGISNNKLSDTEVRKYIAEQTEKHGIVDLGSEMFSYGDYTFGTDTIEEAIRAGKELPEFLEEDTSDE